MSGKRNAENIEWWAPVWRGLVMDCAAAHFRKMGSAVWLFLYFLINANRASGVLMRRVKTISLDMGLPRSTTFRWLKTLREGGYIETDNSGHSLTVQICKWRPVGQVSQLALQKSRSRDSRSPKYETSQMPKEVGKMAPTREEMRQAPESKKNTIKKSILKIDIECKKIDPKKIKSSVTREQVLAYDIAEALDDRPGFPLYLSYVRKYPESLLRETLSRVREIPSHKIKTNRGALFNFLIKQNAKQNQNRAGDQSRNQVLGIGDILRRTAQRLENQSSKRVLVQKEDEKGPSDRRLLDRAVRTRLSGHQETTSRPRLRQPHDPRK